MWYKYVVSRQWICEVRVIDDESKGEFHDEFPLTPSLLRWWLGLAGIQVDPQVLGGVLSISNYLNSMLTVILMFIQNIFINLDIVLLFKQPFSRDYEEF